MYSDQLADKFLSKLLQEPLLHGDEAHRKWLQEEINRHRPYLEELFSEALMWG